MAEITYSTTMAPKFRVYNRCKYDIGVTTVDGRQYNIRPNSFTLLTMDDIEFIESICREKKFFGSGMLEVVDASGKKPSLEQINIVPDEEHRVLTDDEITAALKKSLKAFTEWIDGIDDPVELHAIYTVATTMDLPASKLKVLNAKMPNKDWLDELN